MPTLAKPQSLADLLQLMEEHRYQRIKWYQLLPYDLRDEDVIFFRTRYFLGCRSLSMSELIPFVSHDHRIWPTIVLGVTRVLKDRGIIDQDCRMTDLISSEVPALSVHEYFASKVDPDDN